MQFSCKNALKFAVMFESCKIHENFKRFDGLSVSKIIE